MLKKLFEDQRQSINHFFDALDYDQTEKVFEKFLECTGSIIFSGVGKSGHIAQKIASTFSSIGTRSYFLSPSNALHGDIGAVSKNDLFIVLSKSGQTQELIDLLPHIQKRGVATIAVVSQSGSRLANLCDHFIVLPVQKEVCPYNLAPTTSTAVQLIFGDTIAAAYMRAKKFTLSDFAANHPAGLLGRKITLKVTDLMLKGESIPLCKPTDRLMEVLHELSRKRCGCLLAVDGELRLLGIFTDGDLRRAIVAKGSDALHLTVSEFMTQSPKSTSGQTLAQDAVMQMEENPLRPVTVLPVLEQGRVIGLLRMHDVLQTNPCENIAHPSTMVLNKESICLKPQ